MIISILFILFSAGIGVAAWYLVIGIAFSTGGGSLYIAASYDSLAVNIVLLVLCMIAYFLLAWHLIEQKLESLLLICGFTTLLFFFLTYWFM